MTEIRAVWTHPNLLVIAWTAPVNVNCISGGLIKPYCTALMTGSSFTNGDRSICILPDNLSLLTPNVTLADLVNVACNIMSHVPSCRWLFLMLCNKYV